MAGGRSWSEVELAELRAAACQGPITPAMQRELAIELKRSTAAVAIRAALMGLVQRRPPRDRKEPPIRDDGRYARRLRKAVSAGREHPPTLDTDLRPGTRRPVRVDVLAACKNVV